VDLRTLDGKRCEDGACDLSAARRSCDRWKAFTIRSNSLEVRHRFRYILPVHTTHCGCPETLILLQFSRSLGPWQRIPPSPPPILGNEKVLQNQALPEPPVFGGGAPRWSTAANLFWHSWAGFASQISRPVGALRRRLWISASAIDGGQRVHHSKGARRRDVGHAARFAGFPPF
jgi:hypothetical protein